MKNVQRTTHIELTNHIYLELKAMLDPFAIRFSLNDWMLYVSWHQQKKERQKNGNEIDIRKRITTIQKNKHVKNEIIRNDFMSKSNLM